MCSVSRSIRATRRESVSVTGLLRGQARLGARAQIIGVPHGPGQDPGAARLAPEQPRFAYVYAVGLHSAGRAEEALAVLATARALHPGDPELRDAEAAYRRE